MREFAPVNRGDQHAALMLAIQASGRGAPGPARGKAAAALISISIDLASGGELDPALSPGGRLRWPGATQVDLKVELAGWLPRNGQPNLLTAPGPLEG
jgi:hypothetical protein